jgi:tRNA-2-methylthio-N6-dimethylallyladenosine synthase
MKFLLRTFGCQMNYADSEKIVMILVQSGLKRATELEDADIVILNTCSVRQKGEDRVFGYLRDAKKLAEKRGRPILLGLTGCMVRKTGMRADRYESDRKRAAPKAIERLSSAESVFNSDDRLFGRSDLVDFTFRIEETAYLTKILTVLTGQDIGSDAGYQDYLRLRQAQENKASANVIIQTGCDNFCTFCIVPHTRGRELSRPQDEIVDEVRRVAETGSLEVTLLGQNVNSYGKETRKSLWNAESLTWNSADVKTPFRALLDAVDGIPGIDRIRFTSSNPHDMTRDILDAHFELPRLCHNLHFALQSGSDSMLRRMNRKHTYADFLAQVRYLRGRDPLFGITTDIIVGFPGETE